MATRGGDKSVQGRARRGAGGAVRRASAKATTQPEVVPQKVDTARLSQLVHQLRDWADSALGIAGAAADMSLHVAKSMLPKPEQRAALTKAGSLVRRLREAAGYSVQELGQAIDLDDPQLIDLVEHGKVALPFEIVLRLAAILGRNDPLAFIMNLTRSYNPGLWQTLEDLGIGRLVVQAGREREFANLYRAADAARGLSDEEFAQVLAFTRAAFEMALAFRGAGRSPAGPVKAPRRGS